MWWDSYTHFAANLPLSLSAKKNENRLIFCGSYGQEFSVCFCDSRCIYTERASTADTALDTVGVNGASYQAAGAVEMTAGATYQELQRRSTATAAETEYTELSPRRHHSSALYANVDRLPS